MRRTSWEVLSFIVCAVFAVSLTAPAYAGDEVFVVSSNIRGDANYMSSYGDGTFFSQEILQLTSNTTINVPYKFSYGNGLGDFDNDGDLDYIMAIGYGTGNIYIYEKIGAGNQFADPFFVDTWGILEGYFSGDLAVADYNEDGNADFVLSLGYSNASGLYLGDGDFGFESKLLPNTAAYSSTGADAADFNNDGHADFVIAPASNEQFFVSLGDGKGNFTTSAFDSYDGGAVYGVAAADFTGDGNADIVAAYFDYLYIYQGAGDGKTFTYLASYELPMNRSAIDNYDFNGDGNQDLVVASYAADKAGVAVFLGNGDGTFTYSDTYLGGSVQERNAVTGPPHEPNMDPVAVIEPTYLEVTAGQEIVFDGSYSYDADGNIVSYEWDFGDANTNAGVKTVLSKDDAGRKAEGVNPSHIYYDSGIYTVILVVTDDKGAKDTIQAEVHVAAVPVRVKFSPRSLNLKSRGKWITATIKLPKDYDPKEVDRTSLSVATENSDQIFAKPSPRRGFLAKLWRKIQYRFKVVTVRFDRREVIKAIETPSKKTILNIEGEIFHNGGWVKFAGSGTIKTFNKAKKWNWFSKSKSK